MIQLKLETIQRIELEVQEARTKFPGTKHLLAALVEEVGELAKALLQDKPIEDIQEEATQAAAVAIRIIEEGDSAFDLKDWSTAP
jgi:NTP pyrophosphatase (non-canonical NTP hydrolase)